MASKALHRGFTLVEMVVVAPIVILAIGAFISLIINLTGEVLQSRSSNLLAYNVQDALNRIENDVKLSAGFLATNSITFTSSNPQGRGAVNSTTNFKAVDPTYGQALILSAYATNGNPVSLNTDFVYLANQPNSCSDYAQYSKNAPMVMNIIYFVDSAGTLWRRVVMPSDYATPSTYCGSPAWQRPSCIDDASRHAFCKTDDEKMVDNVGTAGFLVQYFNAASDTTPITVTSSTTTTQLEPATTVSVSISSSSSIAGRDVAKNGSIRVSRLDTNAASINSNPTGSSPKDGDQIQTITSSSCTTTRVRAVDARDNHTYWVQKLADGKCWMLTNLAYAGGGTNTYGDAKTLTNGTGGSSTYTVPSYYVVPSTTNYTVEPTPPSTATTGTGQYGYLYNWCGAMGGQATSACANATTPTPDPSISICPAGWRLPTGDSNGDFKALNNAVNGGSTTTDAGLRTTWLAQRGGNWGVGTFNAQGTYGYYWPSNQYTATVAYMFYFGNTNVNPTNSSGKDGGFAVRCVAS